MFITISLVKVVVIKNKSKIDVLSNIFACLLYIYSIYFGYKLYSIKILFL